MQKTFNSQRQQPKFSVYTQVNSQIQCLAMKVSYIFAALAYPAGLHIKTAAFYTTKFHSFRHLPKTMWRGPHRCISTEQADVQRPLIVHDDKKVKSVVLAWVRNWVIGQGLCPWAASVMSDNKLNITVIRQSYENEHVVDVHNSILQAASNIVDPSTSTETALVALPGITDFTTFLELVADIEEILEHKQLDSYIQLATFHPDYQFEGTESTDVTNYTNRSPCALLHLLSVPQVTAVIDRVNGDTDFVWKNNMKRLNMLGLDKVKLMQAEITNSALMENASSAERNRSK